MRQSTCRSAVAKVSKPIIGGGAYRAVALVGRPLSLARPLFWVM